MGDTRTMLDLFAGAGGLSEGLCEAGFTPLYANELVPQYAHTYSANHVGTIVDTRDIRTVDAHEVRTRLSLEKGDLDLLAGGPPCQGFSINAPVRSTEDKRNHLFREYLRFVEEFQPKAVIIENVPGLVSFEHGATLHAIIDSLASLGYGAGVRILGAAYFGVPQMRWRTIIIATRGRELPPSAFPVPVCHAPIRANFTQTFDGKNIVAQPRPETEAVFTPIEDALDDLPPLENGETGEAVKQYTHEPRCPYQRLVRRGSTGIYNHEAPKLSEINMKRIRYIKPGGNWTDIPEELLPKGMRKARRSDHTKRYGRLKKGELGSTILTKCDPHWGCFLHYEQDRALTVREAARIQSFPDSYVFTGSKAEQYAQVGNAVPPLLAKAIGESIMGLLSSQHDENETEYGN